VTNTREWQAATQLLEIVSETILNLLRISTTQANGSWKIEIHKSCPLMHNIDPAQPTLKRFCSLRASISFHHPCESLREVSETGFVSATERSDGSRKDGAKDAGGRCQSWNRPLFAMKQVHLPDLKGITVLLL
jgi:hypothetical protein